MKRLTNLYDRIISLENLQAADVIASRGKSRQSGVRAHRLKADSNLQLLHWSLREQTYQTSAYTTFTIYEPKERLIHRLPYYPDRITHHAVMNVLEPIFISVFTADSYSCIKGRGIHGLARALRRALNDIANTRYCLKLDIKKFYPSIDHDILKQLLRRKFKDQRLLWLLDEIIDSAPGLPIGNYLSQYFANYYLTGFDHWLKEVMKVRYYFRYSDDIVVLSAKKTFLHNLRIAIEHYLRQLKLSIKKNYQVFPVDARGIDVVGYRFFHTHTLLRKSIKQSFARIVARGGDMASIASYYGWAKHCNSKTLLKKLIHETIQPVQHQADEQGICRRQDSSRQDPQQKDSRACVQN